jgi:hypothetical protein
LLPSRDVSSQLQQWALALARHRPGLSCRTDRVGRARTVRGGKAATQDQLVLHQPGFTEASSAIYDTVTGKLLGHVETPQLTDLALDPLGKFYYVSSTLWTKGMRGTRQDYVSVFDSIDLKHQADITIPGRLLVGGRKHNFVISPDGRFGYVYNMSPASSVNIVDLVARKFVKTIELPGCASLTPIRASASRRSVPTGRWPPSR